MIDTTDLDSYYPGYDEYCEPKEEFDNSEHDSTFDFITDDMIAKSLEDYKKSKEQFKVLEGEESEENGLH